MVKLYNDDCKIVLRNFDTESVDLTITSPPYDNLRDYRGYVFDFKGIASELYRVTKIGGVIVWVVADSTINGSESGTSFEQALYFKKIGFNIHDTMIWLKSTFTDTGSLKVRYGNVFEYMFIFSKGKPKTFNPIKDRKNLSAGSLVHGTVRQRDGSVKPITTIGKKISEYGQRFNVWAIEPEKSNKNRFHPAQFPVKLATDHIISWSNENDTILDCFMGSGTTGVACKLLNRNFIGIEIDKDYFNIAQERINNAGKNKLF